MSSTVSVGNMEISSNTESASDMVEALKPVEDKGKQPRAIQDKGRPVKEPDNALSEAASQLGKKGGEAAAKARQKGVDEQERKAEGQMAKEAGVAEAKAPEAEPGKEQTDSEKRRHDARTRIEQLARERAEAREAAERAEARRLELEERLARLEAERAQKPEPAAAEPSGDDRPDVANFEKYEDYVEALTDWKMDQRIKRLREESEVTSRQEAMTHEQVEREVTFLERMQTTQEADPEIMERIDPKLTELLHPTPPGLPATASSTIADEVLASETPLQLLAYFTEHPEEVRRMAKMSSAREIARAVARIEDKLGGNGTAQPEPATEPKARSSNAPPPIKPLTPSSAPGEADIYGDGIDFDTFAKRRKKG